MDMFRVGLLLPGYLQLSAGRSRKVKSEIFSSVQHLFILFTIGQAILCWGLSIVVPANSSWNFFFQNYPWIILSGGAIALSEWWFQSNMRFQYIFFVRAFNRVGIILLSFFFAYELKSIVYIQAGINFLTSLAIIASVKLPGFRNYNYKAHHFKLFNFGKYSTPTQLASNLLRSSDTLMISYAMGAAATGIYGAAAKFLEFVELPIRSLGAVLFGRLAKLANTDQHQDAYHAARKYVITTTVRILPVALFLGILAPQLIIHISGPNFADSIPLLRVMAIYCLLIPADRCCGILLEAFGRPDLNLLKVVVMFFSNVIGDVVAIYFFHSPLAVACSSIITFSVGIAFGYWLIVAKGMPRQNVNFEMVMEQN